MSVYRVTMKINFLVEIDDKNALADPRPALQGDTAQSALNRACWVWLKGSREVKPLNKRLGVKRAFARKKDWEAIRFEDAGQEAAPKVPAA